jgi:transcriptional regulator NrdR family protein
MECPMCGDIDNQVIDSRLAKDGISIRRRRECLFCTGRFTTYEATEERLLSVLIRNKAGHGVTISKFEAMLSFLSSTLKTLSQETKQLIDKVGRFEKAQAALKYKGAASVRAASGKTSAVKTTAARKTASPTATDAILKIIKRHKKGVGIRKLRDRTGFDDKKIRNIVYRASKQGKIKRNDRGVYTIA